jgi:2,5-dioxopentanoate dehydrogenase
MPAVRTLAHDHWKNLIAGEPVDATDATYTARGALAHFEEASSAHVDRALEAATQAVDPDRGLPPDARAAFVERIAAEIEASDELIKAAHVETALPTQRLAGERGRTAGQLRMFAALVREGSWVDVRIDRALPQRTPLSKPDVRRMLIPIGPVAVFGAPYPAATDSRSTSVGTAAIHRFARPVAY